LIFAYFKLKRFKSTNSIESMLITFFLENYNNIVLFYIAFLSSGMISTFPYLSNKSITIPEKLLEKILAIIVVLPLCSLMMYDFVVGSFVTISIYCLSGPFIWIYINSNLKGECEVIESTELSEENNKSKIKKELAEKKKK